MFQRVEHTFRLAEYTFHPPEYTFRQPECKTYTPVKIIQSENENKYLGEQNEKSSRAECISRKMRVFFRLNTETQMHGGNNYREGKAHRASPFSMDFVPSKNKNSVPLCLCVQFYNSKALASDKDFLTIFFVLRKFIYICTQGSRAFGFYA